MGCAGSLDSIQPGPSRVKKGGGKKKGGKAKKGKSGQSEKGSKVEKVGGKDKGGKTSVAALSKNKFIGEQGAVMQDITQEKEGILVVFIPTDGDGLTFSFRGKDGTLYAAEFTEAKFKHAKDSAGISFGWAAVFKSLVTEMQKGPGRVHPAPGGCYSYDFLVRNVKAGVASQAEPFEITLSRVTTSSSATKRLFMLPMVARVQAARRSEDEATLHACRLECDEVICKGETVRHEKARNASESQMGELRKEAAKSKELVQNSLAMIARMETKRSNLIYREEMKKAEEKKRQRADNRRPLDRLYEDGGAQYYRHLPFAVPHHPELEQISEPLCDFIEQSMKEEGAVPLENVLSSYPLIPSDGVEAANLRENFDGVWSVLETVDNWDYNVFTMDSLTNNNALFYTTYALLHKLGLPAHFGFDDAVLRRLLQAIQSGYHPNPYHNATHAADVTHIVYYILVNGGMQDVCPLIHEEILAAILAAAIHDYDHPGFNNNFHTRTSAYLATFYNDRSILENHHLACVFEMLRHPSFNLFGHLHEDQRKEIRDVMIEMVLSTDMGIHGKILSQFQRRIQEGAQWSQRKEDLRLALSMVMKMADVSNSGRPTHLYTAWAKNIAAEFYDQGDYEQRLKLDVSPFMNRARHLQDFARGQTSFMGFVIVPMFESIVELLPNMGFVLDHATANKEYWSSHTPGDLGSLRRRISCNTNTNSNIGSPSASVSMSRHSSVRSLLSNE